MLAINRKALIPEVNYSFLEGCTDLPSLALLQHGLGHAGGQIGVGAAHIGGHGGIGGIMGGAMGGAGC